MKLSETMHMLRRPGVVLVCAIGLAMVVGTTGAVAAGTIGPRDIKRDAVHSKHIKNGAVHTRDLRAGSVTAAKVAADSLTGAQINESTLTVSPSGAAGGDLAGTYPNPTIGTGKVGSAAVADGALTGSDVADNSLKGADIDESSLGQVPSAATLGDFDSTSFLHSGIYKTEAVTDTGTVLGDGTEVKSMSCDPGDLLLAGGPASVNAGSVLLDSFATSLTTWQARIKPVAGGDNFTVVILCVNQSPLNP